MKIFFDTNIWLRLLLKDHPTQFEETFALFESIEQGKFNVYTSSIVFLEIHFVLKRIYHKSDQEIISTFEKIKQLRGLTIIEETNLTLAIKYYKEVNIKFSDCLIASQLSKNMVLVSYDQEFSKITGLNLKKPGELS